MTNGFVVTFYVAILVASIVTTYIYVDKWRKGQREKALLTKERDTLKMAYDEVRQLQWGTQLACTTMIQRFAPVCDDCGDTIDGETTVIGRDQQGIYVCCAECAHKNHMVGYRDQMAHVDGDEHDLGVVFDAWENKDP